ncbi:TIGR03086 family metal-binding protein [Pseudonocardia pini]|uniref:TIGR03086 family metal-binding protein n=1 Tax=Pseudonocardia pini TaxID=2758030 RepID=UPI0015F005A0|nr:TIGR03086 family metal-binding protein [Pseudonocardia pini]
MTTTEIDPRTLYTDALDWAAGLVAGVRADQLHDPTPCTELDVEGLLRHLVATVDKFRAVGAGDSPLTKPFQVDPVADWPAALTEARERMWTVWSDDAVLDTEVTVPWGSVPGRAAVWGYVNETLVHGWDLAVATGQPAEAPAELVLPVLAAARAMIPGGEREGFPFDPPVDPAATAGPTEQLANWSGRRS